MDLSEIRNVIIEFLVLGGPVVSVLLSVSVVTLTTILLKLWQFFQAGVGQRSKLERALLFWDQGAKDEARALVLQSKSHLRHIMSEAMRAVDTERQSLNARLIGRSDAALSKLESGFRLLDSIAQLAPLLGLFGTVLGMIEAFRELQGAGSSVDPSILAGGIWVALLTTAVGLAVAMPASLVLTWLEGRLSRDRVFADKALAMLLCPEASVGPRA